MEAFQRPQVETLCNRLAEQPHHIIAVFGPRQTGKTTLVSQALRRSDRPSRHLRLDEVDAGKVTSEAEDTFRLPRKPDTEWLVQTWRQARQEADSHPLGLVLVLDEIQALPDWSATVKGLWDADRAENRQLHVVLLGSAPILIQSGLTESLAGRFEPIQVTHWSFDEMADAFGFDLTEYIYFGGYPGTARYIREEPRWRDYVLGSLVQPNIDKDILAMTRVDKPALLKQLFELGADYSGQILPFSKMLGQLQDAGNATTLARYLDLLSTAGLLAGLPKYAPSFQRVRASSPKLNILNTALMTAGSGYTFEQAQADRTFWGRLVESAVGAHILNTASNDIRTHYWREKLLEVDFVLRRGRRTVAIEVKSGRDRGRLRGLEAFEQKFNPHRAMLVGERGTPLDEFLSTPADRWFDEP
ncbi:MAG: AAA family ATPase [Gammaproteobacteria bacterium]|nr:AAA family ATPase [Gammaproteobacteria bacterium]MDE0274102.1 AAA family ATPase [Gammaproteobacteria bacterium]